MSRIAVCTHLPGCTVSNGTSPIFTHACKHDEGAECAYGRAVDTVTSPAGLSAAIIVVLGHAEMINMSAVKIHSMRRESACLPRRVRFVLSSESALRTAQQPFAGDLQNGGGHREGAQKLSRPTLPLILPSTRFGRRAVPSLFAVAALVGGLLIHSGSAAAATAVGMYTGAEVPAHPAESDSSAVELGVTFSVSVPGSLVGLRYHRSAQNSGTHTGSLWTSSGARLAGLTFPSTTAVGWQYAPFKNPVALKVGTTYVASYHTNTGYYAQQQYAFNNGQTIGNSIIRGRNGVYNYGSSSAFPSQSWDASSYYVDAIFQPATSTTTSSAVPTTSATASSPASAPTTTSSAASAPTTTASAAPAPTRTSPAPVPTTTSSSAASAPAPSTRADSTNTGYQNAPGYPGSLTTFSGTLASNTTYRFMYFPNGLAVGNASSAPSNVSFVGCLFASNATVDANVAVYGKNINFSYSTFAPLPNKASAPPLSYANGYQYGIDQRNNAGLSVDHSDFWGWGNAIQIGSSSQANPVTVTNSYFHDARNDGGIDHTDAILENYGGAGFGYMSFSGNTIVSAGNTNGLALQDGSGAGYDHLTVTNNYFSGFGYTVNIGGHGTITNSSFTGNTFSNAVKAYYGPLYDYHQGVNTVWRNNRFETVAGGATPFPATGMYWWPTDSNGHSTDYTG